MRPIHVLSKFKLNALSSDVGYTGDPPAVLDADREVSFKVGTKHPVTDERAAFQTPRRHKGRKDALRV